VLTPGSKRGETYAALRGVLASTAGVASGPSGRKDVRDEQNPPLARRVCWCLVAGAHNYRCQHAVEVPI